MKFRTLAIVCLATIIVAGCLPPIEEKDAAQENEVIYVVPAPAPVTTKSKQPHEIQFEEFNDAIGMANPASVHCKEVGGSLRIEKKPPSGSEYGVCYFDDNRQCEEWALFRDECPLGGKKVTGYITPASRYCAIIGGQYSMTGFEGEEQGSCTLKNGNVCDVWELWEGKCNAS